MTSIQIYFFSRNIEKCGVRDFIRRIVGVSRRVDNRKYEKYGLSYRNGGNGYKSEPKRELSGFIRGFCFKLLMKLSE